MKQVRVSARGQWRQWLAENHDKEASGVWLVLQKQSTCSGSLEYAESAGEALCFGWIDSIIIPGLRAGHPLRASVPARDGRPSRSLSVVSHERTGSRAAPLN